MTLYCIYDKAAEESGPIFEAKNDMMALRMYNGVNLPGHPNDFELLKIGEYIHCPVKVTGYKEPVTVRSGVQHVEDENETI